MKFQTLIFILALSLLQHLNVAAQTTQWETQQLPMVLDARNGNNDLYVLLKPEDLEQLRNKTIYIWLDGKSSRLAVSVLVSKSINYQILISKNSKAIGSTWVPQEVISLEGNTMLFEYNLGVASVIKAASSQPTEDFESPFQLNDTVYLKAEETTTGKKRTFVFSFVFWYCPPESG